MSTDTQLTVADVMSDSLVADLLAAIERVEMAAQDSAGCRSGEWAVAEEPPRQWGDSEPDQEIIAGGKPIARLDAEYGGYFHAVHMVLNDPPAVYRLCRVHRKIVGMYQDVKAQPVHREGREAKLRGLDHASAMGRLTTLGLVVQALAEGYGVGEKGSNE